MEPWRAWRPVLVDLHYFDEVQDPEVDPHLSEKSDSDPGSVTLNIFTITICCTDLYLDTVPVSRTFL
jgi:hypothetical protein